MGLKLNKRGETYAQARINTGKIDYYSEWSFSDDERNALFAEGIERFADWHLGRDADGGDDTASSYQFTCGKDGVVHRSALEAIIKGARKLKKNDPACADIEAAAKELRDRIDHKMANSRKLMFFGPRECAADETDPRKRFEGVILVDATLVLGDHPDMVEGGGPEGWTQICRTGKWLGHWQGPFEGTDDDIAVMVENFNRFVLPVMFDYGHESCWDSGAIASGWGHEFEIGKKGNALYSNTEWTRRAADHIRAGEYKYISPVIVFNTTDPYTGEDIGPSIWSVALTNTPFLDGMDAVEIGGQIAASRKALNGAPLGREWKPRQVEMTHNSPTKTPEPEPEPEPAPEPEVTINKSTTEDDMSLKEIALSLGLPETATADEIKTAIAAKDNTATQAATDAKALSDAQAAQAKAEEDGKLALQRAEALETEKKEREEREAKDLVEAYIKAGRVAPASREKAVALALGDRASFDGLYGKTDEPGQAVVPMGDVAPAEPAAQVPGHGVAALSDEENEAIAKMRPRLERLAAKRSARLSKEQGRPVTCTVEEMIADEKTRRAGKGLLGKTFEHPPVANTTRVK